MAAIVVMLVMSGYTTIRVSKKLLEKLKEYGLDDKEIELILDGMDLEKAYITAVYGRS